MEGERTRSKSVERNIPERERERRREEEEEEEEEKGLNSESWEDDKQEWEETCKAERGKKRGLKMKGKRARGQQTEVWGETCRWDRDKETRREDDKQKCKEKTA